MTILVTGATGLLGNNVVRILLDQGKRIRVLVRNTSDAVPLEGLDIEVLQGDITDSLSVREAVKSTIGVVHCAGFVQTGSTNNQKHDRINRRGTLNIGEACRTFDIPLVHVSTVDALGISGWDEPATETTAHNEIEVCPYVLSKRAAASASWNRRGYRPRLSIRGSCLALGIGSRLPEKSCWRSLSNGCHLHPSGASVCATFEMSQRRSQRRWNNYLLARGLQPRPVAMFWPVKT
mgnify:CR=1 FL=1